MNYAVRLRLAWGSLPLITIPKSKDNNRVKSAQKLGDGNVESLGTFGESQLTALCEALQSTEAEKRAALTLFRSVGESWADYPLGDGPPFKNDITDDGTPFEFSVGFETQKPELRMLFESHGCTTRPRSSWEAGKKMQRRLQQQGLADTTRFECIAPLFAPRDDYDLPRFSLWHAAVMRSGSAPLFKAYVNPEVVGADRAPTLLAEALGRLNLSSCWSFVEKRLNRDVRLPYLSLDLDTSQHARVKIYLGATNADSVEDLLVGCRNFRRGEARQWLRTLTGYEGEYDKRPILVCFSFTSNAAEAKGTLHVPVRSYVSGDEEALRRTAPLLTSAAREKLGAAMSSLAMRPLEKSRGVLSYVSLRPIEGRVRVTTYLAPGAYSVAKHHYSSGTHPKG